MTDSRNKIYFLSDFHLGAPDRETSLPREKHIVKFLNEIKNDASHIFILGDLFDFWYEYKKVVPKGFVRILGKLAELADSGIVIKFFVGNHDMWMNGYFENELGIEVFHKPQEFEFSGKKFFIGHGDGLGPGDHGYKAMKKVFRNPVCHWMFGILPPFIGVGIANYFSHKSRSATGDSEENFLGEEKEWLLIYSREMLKLHHFDFFVFGHRHLPIDYRLKDNSRYINLGEWMNFSTYAIFDGGDMEVKSYSGMEHKIYKNW